MACIRVQLAYLVPGQAGSPYRMARDIRIHGVPKHLAIDFQIASQGPFFTPQGMFTERPKLGVEIPGPDLGRFHDVRIAIEYDKALAGHDESSPRDRRS